MSQELSFQDWMTKVNNLASKKMGVSIMDLPDFRYRDEYDSGASPAECVESLMEESGFDALLEIDQMIDRTEAAIAKESFEDQLARDAAEDRSVPEPGHSIPNDRPGFNPFESEPGV